MRKLLIFIVGIFMLVSLTLYSRDILAAVKLLPELQVAVAVSDGQADSAMGIIKKRLSVLKIDVLELRKINNDRIFVSIPMDGDYDDLVRVITTPGLLILSAIKETSNSPRDVPLLFIDPIREKRIVGFRGEEFPLAPYCNGVQIETTGDTREYYLSVSLNKEGTEKFSDFTARYARKELAMILDGIVINVSFLQERITSGAFRLFTEKILKNIHQARYMAALLQSGPLTSNVTLIEHKVVNRK